MDLTPPTETFDAVWWGLAAGAVGVLLPRPIAASLLTVGAVAAMVAADAVPGDAAVALVVLAAADLARWAGRVRHETYGEAVLIACLVLAASADRWALLVAAVPVVLGLALTDLDRRHRRWRAGPVTVAAAAAGAYACLPDTEQAAVVLGALVAGAAVLAVFDRLALGHATSIAALLLWVAAVGGRGRDGAVVGAVAALGIALVEPAVHAVARTQVAVRTVVPTRWMAALVAGQFGIALYAGRVAGLESSADRATTLAALAVVPAGIAATVLTTQVIGAASSPHALDGGIDEVRGSSDVRPRDVDLRGHEPSPLEVSGQRR